MTLKHFELLKYRQHHYNVDTQQHQQQHHHRHQHSSRIYNDSDMITKSYQSSRDLLEDDFVRADVRQRCIHHQYYPSEFRSKYTPEYVTRLTREATSKAEQNLIFGRAALQLQSPLIAAKSVNTDHIIKHLHPERKQIQLDENDLKRIAKTEYEIYCNRKMRTNYQNQLKDNLKHYNSRTSLKNCEMQKNTKNLIRGKSPTTIASALLAETENNLNKGKHEEEVFIRQAMQSLRLYVSDRQNFKKDPYIPMYKLKLRGMS